MDKVILKFDDEKTLFHQKICAVGAVTRQKYLHNSIFYVF